MRDLSCHVGERTESGERGTREVGALAHGPALAWQMGGVEGVRVNRMIQVFMSIERGDGHLRHAFRSVSQGKMVSWQGVPFSPPRPPQPPPPARHAPTSSD